MCQMVQSVIQTFRDAIRSYLIVLASQAYTKQTLSLDTTLVGLWYMQSILPYVLHESYLTFYTNRANLLFECK